jgi:pyroglutamyl-peptidase
MLTRAAPRPTVLLTGFGPFPGVPINVSAELVRRVVRRARRASPEFQFATAILPTEWGRAPRLIGALHGRYRPVLALHFGVASGTECLRLERTALNVCRPSPDAAGVLPFAESLSDNGPPHRHTTIAIDAMAEQLNGNGHSASISDDAGGYLCNAVLYHSLAFAEVHGGCNVGFVHIPADLSEPGRMNELSRGALDIIKIALAPVSEPVSLTST